MTGLCVFEALISYSRFQYSTEKVEAQSCSSFSGNCPWIGFKKCVLSEMALLSLCVCPSRMIQTNNTLNYVLKGFCTFGAFKFSPIMHMPPPPKNPQTIVNQNTRWMTPSPCTVCVCGTVLWLDNVCELTLNDRVLLLETMMPVVWQGFPWDLISLAEKQWFFRGTAHVSAVAGGVLGNSCGFTGFFPEKRYCGSR